MSFKVIILEVKTQDQTNYLLVEKRIYHVFGGQGILIYRVYHQITEPNVYCKFLFDVCSLSHIEERVHQHFPNVISTKEIKE